MAEQATGGGGASGSGPPPPPGGGRRQQEEEEDEALVLGEGEGDVLDDLDGDAAAPISDDDDDDDGGGGGGGGGGEAEMMMADGDDDGEDDSLQVFDGHQQPVLAVAWSPAAAPGAAARDLVATGGQDDGAFLWRVGQDALEATGGTLSTTRLGGHTDSVAAVAFSHDGGLLATGGLDGSVRVWDPAAAMLQASGAGGGGGGGAAGGGGGGGGGGDADDDDDSATQGLLRVLDGPGGGIEWLAWHPRGEVVLAGSEDYTAWMWLARTGQCLGVLSGHGGAVAAGAFTPDGRTVVTAGGRGDASLRRWNPKTGECTGVLSGHPFHPGDQPAAADADDDDDDDDGDVEGGGRGGKGAKEQGADGEQEEEEEEEEDEDPGGGLTCLSIHSDGVACLTGAADGTLRVSNLQTMRVIASPEGHTASVEAVGFCPGAAAAAIAASAGLDAFLRVWDAGAGFAPRAAVEHPEGVTRLAWHPHQPAVVATACLDGRVRLCDLRTGAVVRGGGGGGAVMRGHRGAVQDVCFSPDGRFLLSGSDDGTARVFAVQ